MDAAPPSDLVTVSWALSTTRCRWVFSTPSPTPLGRALSPLSHTSSHAHSLTRYPSHAPPQEKMAELRSSKKYAGVVDAL
jgi:hypothetical protein